MGVQSTRPSEPGGVLRALLTKHEGWRAPIVVGWPASAPDAPGAGALLDLLCVPMVAAELMQSHTWRPAFLASPNQTRGSGLAEFLVGKVPSSPSLRLPQTRLACALRSHARQVSRPVGQVPREIVCQPFLVPLGCRHQGAGRWLEGESQCQVSLEDAAGPRLPAREYRLGVSFEICLLSL